MYENTGFIASGYDPSDVVIEAESQRLPESYSYDTCFCRVKDQGRTSKCVPYSISYSLELLNSFNGRSIEVDVDDIYDQRTNSGDGMMIREAMQIIKNSGYKFKGGEDKIQLFGRLTNEKAIKWSLVANGPCIMALPVRSNDTHFWRGDQDMGGHAICCIGYNEYGFELLNTWGATWGDFGQCTLPYEEVNSIIECWTIV